MKRAIRASDAASQTWEHNKLRMVCMTLLAVRCGLGQGQDVVSTAGYCYSSSCQGNAMTTGTYCCLTMKSVLLRTVHACLHIPAKLQVVLAGSSLRLQPKRGSTTGNTKPHTEP
jgi:hypothetical protein